MPGAVDDGTDVLNLVFGILLMQICMSEAPHRKGEKCMSHRPVVLMILDGYGLNDNPEANAIAMANTPVMDKLMAE